MHPPKPAGSSRWTCFTFTLPITTRPLRRPWLPCTSLRRRRVFSASGAFQTTPRGRLCTYGTLASEKRNACARDKVLSLPATWPSYSLSAAVSDIASPRCSRICSLLRVGALSTVVRSTYIGAVVKTPCGVPSQGAWLATPFGVPGHVQRGHPGRGARAAAGAEKVRDEVLRI